MKPVATLNIMTGNMAELARLLPQIVAGLELPEGRYGVKVVITGPLTSDEAVTYLMGEARRVEIPVPADPTIQ